eukprot:scaffold4444_cov32-Phaeocystis_antarctica.AAC.1
MPWWHHQGTTKGQTQGQGLGQGLGSCSARRARPRPASLGSPWPPGARRPQGRDSSHLRSLSRRLRRARSV